jgi:hypothetical protein
VVRDIRLPWVHKTDPVAFHSARMILTGNHVRVPLWRSLRTKSWLVEDLGWQLMLNVPLQLYTCTSCCLGAEENKEITNVSPCSLHLLTGEEQLRPQVSTGCTNLVLDTYPEHVECLLSTPSRSSKRAPSKTSATDQAGIAYLLSYYSRDYTTYPTSA